MTRIQEIAKVDGFGESAKLIREEINPLWGIAKGSEKHYVVHATVTTTEDISISVIADNEEDASKKARDEMEDEYCGEIEIDIVQETKPKTI